jgi:branched-chain amino acid transport system substrate-binding protein
MKVAIAAVNGGGGIGGRPLELRTFSTENTAAGAVAAYREAAADPEIVASFFGAVSGALAVKAASDEVGLPIVIATASDDVDEPLARNVFKNSFSGEYATSSFTYIAGQHAVQRVAELHFGTDYSVGISDALESRCEELGCEIVASESADAGASVDALIPQLTSMAAANPN